VNAIVRCLFPPLCFHCEERAYQDRLLCQLCLEKLILLSQEGRCPRCFRSFEEENICQFCHEESSPFYRLAACFDQESPIRSLLQAFKERYSFFLEKPLASFFVLQWQTFDWPLPDLITFVPQTPIKKLLRGYNQSERLATMLGRLFDRRVVSLLKRREGGLSQTLLNTAQRRELSKETFAWKKRENLQNKIVLLIDDHMETRTTLYRCGELLQEALPEQLFGLTLSCSDKWY